MAESFQRRVNANIQTQGEVRSYTPLGIGSAVATVAEGFETKRIRDEKDDEESRKLRIKQTADSLLDDYREKRNQLGSEFNSVAERQAMFDKVGSVDPDIRFEVETLIAGNLARRQAQGEILTPADIQFEQQQSDLRAVNTNPEQFGLPAGTVVAQEDATKLMNGLRQLQAEKARVDERNARILEEEGLERKEYVTEAGRLAADYNTLTGGLLYNINNIAAQAQDEEAMANLLTSRVGDIKASKGEAAQRFAMLERKVAEDPDALSQVRTNKEEALKYYDSIIENLEALQEAPLEEAKRRMELMSNQFFLDNPAVLKANKISNLMGILDERTRQEFNDLLLGVAGKIKSEADKDKFIDAFSNPEVSQDELDEAFKTLPDDDQAKALLSYHKMMLDSYVAGKSGAKRPAIESALYITNNIDYSPDQAPQLLKLATNFKQKAYPELNDTEKQVLDYSITQSTRDVIGDPQVGLWADVVKNPVAKGVTIGDVTVNQQDLLVYSNGKYSVNNELLDKAIKAGEESVPLFGRGVDTGEIQRDTNKLIKLKKDMEKVVKQTNSILEQSRGLDAPALKEMSPTERDAFMSGTVSGVNLADYSNIPRFSGDEEEVAEGIQQGLTREGVQEMRTEKQRNQDYRNMSNLLMTAFQTDDLEKQRGIASQIEQYRGKLPDNVVDKALSTLNVKIGAETAESIENANVTRAEQATEVQGRPANQEALAPLPEEVVNDEEFKTSFNKWTGELNANPEDLARILHFESGGTFAPDKANEAGSGAVGLIQFMDGAASDLGTTVEELAQMTRAEQMDYAGRYIKMQLDKRNVKNPTLSDLYMAVLRPASVGKPEDSTVYKKGSKAYEANKGLDTNNDGKITKQEAVQKVVENTEMADLKSLFAEAKSTEEREALLVDLGLVE